MSDKRVTIRRYAMRKLIFAVPTVLMVIILVFAITHLAPGDPVHALAGDVGASREYLDFLREKYGLNQPIYIQFITYLGLLIKGDLGFSIFFSKPVATLIMDTALPSVLLMVASTLFSVAFGIVLGLLAARKPHGKTDSAISMISLLGYAMPVFWLGQLVLIAFSLNLSWFPYAGMSDPRKELTGLAYILDVMHHLFLPAVTLGFVQTSLIAQMTRTGVVEALGKNFVTAARAKGLPERTVLFKHALRDAMTLVVTVVGLNIGRVLAGAILTETTFSWPGLGRLLWQAMVVRDYPLVMGIFIVVAIVVIVVNFVVDIVYAMVDPRIRYR